MRRRARALELPRWRDSKGEPLSCVEKIKMLNQNLEEIHELSQEAFEDGLLMGCEEAQLREALAALVGKLENPYRRKR